MKVVFITRATLYSVEGGDTFQVLHTARHLNMMGVGVDIRLTNEEIDYSQYDLLHFFNIIRPADISYHIRKSGKPYVVSTLLIDYSSFDKHHRKGLPGWVCKYLSTDAIEYLKTIARFLLGKDELRSRSYVWKGHQRSVRQILEHAAYIFPNTIMEHDRLVSQYECSIGWEPVPNGLDSTLFRYEEGVEKEESLVLCVGRIEGIKNQVNLIKALNNTRYRLLLIGSPAPNQQAYYRECRRLAASNVEFLDHLPQQELVPWYRRAKVHILPSWFEICGLSSLEAGAMGCNIVITDRGYTREYYEDHAFYCDPGNPDSIRTAVEHASVAEIRPALRHRIETNYSWSRAAASISRVYGQILSDK